jgi:hypothetical protein
MNFVRSFSVKKSNSTNEQQQQQKLQNAVVCNNSKEERNTLKKPFTDKSNHYSKIASVEIAEFVRRRGDNNTKSTDNSTTTSIMSIATSLEEDLNEVDDKDDCFSDDSFLFDDDDGVVRTVDKNFLFFCNEGVSRKPFPFSLNKKNYKNIYNTEKQDNVNVTVDKLIFKNIEKRTTKNERIFFLLKSDDLSTPQSSPRYDF